MSQTKAQLIDTLVASLLPASDSSVDIGSNGVRFANIYGDTLYGDGSNLTGITSTTINSNADNRLITGSGSANTLNGEASLTFDGTKILDITSSSGGFFRGTDSDGGVGLLEMGNGDVALQADTGNAINNSKIHFFVDNTERMRIDSSGNVGIGTTSPSRKLDVVGDAEFIHDNGITIEATSTSTAGQLTIIGVNASDQISAITRIKSISTGSSTAATATAFENRNSSNAMNEHMRITSTGNVGIGTTSPSTKLDVIGDIRTSTNIYVGESIFHDGDNDTRLIFDTADRLKIETAGVERVAFGGVTTFNETGADVNFRIEGDTDENLFFLDAGNDRVGIGTNNPNGKFVVARETSRTNDVEHLLIMTHTSSGTTTTGFGTGIRFQGERNNGALQTIGDINFEADVNSGTNISAALVFKPSTSGSPTEKMRLTSDGKLGIGTSSPDSKLKLQDSSDVVIHILKTGSQDTLLKNTGQTELCAASGGANGQRIVFKIGANTGALNDIAKFTDTGLCFGSDTAAANALDDYEEGTFTPEYNAGSSASACFAGGISYDSQVGHYTKVGNVVSFQLKVDPSSSGLTAKSGILQINNLPFNCKNVQSNGGAFYVLTSAFNATSVLPNPVLVTNNNAIQFYKSNAANFAGNELPAPANYIQLAGFYLTD